MRYIIAIFVAVLAAALAYCTSNERIATKIRFFNIMSAYNPDEFPSLKLKSVHLILITVIVGAASFFAVLSVLNATTDVIFVCRMAIALLCLVASGCFDLRQRRIPNIFPAILAVSAVLLLVASAILYRENAVAQITSSAIAAVVCCVLLVLAATITKDGIGAGDIKLIGALALMMGTYVVLGALFFSALLCCVSAIVIVVFKLNDRCKSVPFAPFLLIGYIVSLLINNF